MKIPALITRITGMLCLWKILSVIAVAVVVSYIYSHGISPVWTAVAVIFLRGLFKFLYRIACFIVTAILLCAILGFLIF